MIEVCQAQQLILKEIKESLDHRVILENLVNKGSKVCKIKRYYKSLTKLIFIICINCLYIFACFTYISIFYFWVKLEIIPHYRCGSVIDVQLRVQKYATVQIWIRKPMRRKFLRNHWTFTSYFSIAILHLCCSKISALFGWEEITHHVKQYDFFFF